MGSRDRRKPLSRAHAAEEPGELVLEVLDTGREPRGPTADLAHRSRALLGGPTDRISVEARAVLPAAFWMLSVMPRVDIACCSTAAEIVVATAVNSWMLWAIEATSPTAPWVAAWIAATCCEISSVARDVWLASALTSAATTAKPLPASPARAASMVALSASRLVCAAILEISPTTEPMRSAASFNDRMF